MLFWLFVIIAVVSFVLIWISIEKDWDWEDVFVFFHGNLNYLRRRFSLRYCE